MMTPVIGGSGPPTERIGESQVLKLGGLSYLRMGNKINIIPETIALLVSVVDSHFSFNLNFPFDKTAK